MGGKGEECDGRPNCVGLLTDSSLPSDRVVAGSSQGLATVRRLTCTNKHVFRGSYISAGRAAFHRH